jgi:hypothetical protein
MPAALARSALAASRLFERAQFDLLVARFFRMRAGALTPAGKVRRIATGRTLFVPDIVLAPLPLLGVTGLTGRAVLGVERAAADAPAGLRFVPLARSGRPSDRRLRGALRLSFRSADPPAMVAAIARRLASPVTPSRA